MAKPRTARVLMRGVPAVVAHGPGTSTAGRLGVGAIGDAGVVLSIEHPDGSIATAMLTEDGLDQLADRLREVFGTERAAPAGATLQ